MAARPLQWVAQLPISSTWLDLVPPRRHCAVTRTLVVHLNTVFLEPRADHEVGRDACVADDGREMTSP